MDFSDLFSNGKSDGSGPRRVDQAARLGFTMDRGGGAVPWQRVGARARRSLPMVVEEDEPDEAVPLGCSSEHERRRRGGVTEAKNGGGLSSTRGRRKARGSSGERGKRGGEGQGCSSPFIGSGGRRRWPG
jgi:hypothetical protein